MGHPSMRDVDELIDEWFEAVEVVGSIAHPNLLNLHVVCK